MISRSRKNKEILLDEIANVLPVNTPFSKIEFCELTGMLKASSGFRLRTLVDDKQLLKNGPSNFTMTPEMKEQMFIQAENNLHNRGKSKKVKPKKDVRKESEIKADEKLIFSTAWI